MRLVWVGTIADRPVRVFGNERRAEGWVSDKVRTVLENGGEELSRLHAPGLFSVELRNVAGTARVEVQRFEVDE